MKRARRRAPSNDFGRGTTRSAELEAADQDYVVAVALMRDSPRNDVRAREITKFASEQRENARGGKAHFVCLREMAEKLAEASSDVPHAARLRQKFSDLGDGVCGGFFEPDGVSQLWLDHPAVAHWQPVRHRTAAYLRDYQGVHGPLLRDVLQHTWTTPPLAMAWFQRQSQEPNSLASAVHTKQSLPRRASERRSSPPTTVDAELRAKSRSLGKKEANVLEAVDALWPNGDWMKQDAKIRNERINKWCEGQQRGRASERTIRRALENHRS